MSESSRHRSPPRAAAQRRHGIRRASFLAATLLALSGGLAALSAEVDPEDRTLLEEADVSREAPTSFRAEIRVGRVGSQDSMPLELWRDGERVLVRFLGPEQEGKFLIQRGDELYFLAPGTRNPVRLDSRFRLGGRVSLTEILGMDYSRSYEIRETEHRGEGEGRQVIFELEAREESLPYPRVRFVVRESTGRPLRVEHLLTSGKTAKIVEFAAWKEGEELEPGRLVIKDPLRGTAPVTVEFVEVEERAAPEGIFDLEEGEEARKSLGS
ncbi:MAG: outer membrane lipoprotein-sorting protein [Thermoanaerobaculia bacterium]|nr:outer membrane lipoprotein-sorting protein [Thermoanaerobaculia bacterium]